MRSDNTTSKAVPCFPLAIGQLLRVSILLVFVATVGCFDPSNFDKDKMAKEVTEQWAAYKVADVKLNPVEGGFEGTAKAADGESFKIKIATDHTTKSASGSGTGDRGTELSFSVKAQYK